jgi:hypothetical protein
MLALAKKTRPLGTERPLERMTNHLTVSLKVADLRQTHAFQNPWSLQSISQHLANSLNKVTLNTVRPRSLTISP